MMRYKKLSTTKTRGVETTELHNAETLNARANLQSSLLQRLQPSEPSDAILVGVLQGALRDDLIQTQTHLPVLLQEQALAGILSANVLDTRRDGVQHFHQRELIVHLLSNSENADVADDGVDNEDGLMRGDENLVVARGFEILRRQLDQERPPVQPLLRWKPMEPLQQDVARAIGEEHAQNHGGYGDPTSAALRRIPLNLQNNRMTNSTKQNQPLQIPSKQPGI